MASSAMASERFHRFDLGNHPMHNSEGERVHDAGDNEERHVSVEPLQCVTGDERQDHAAHGAPRASQARDRANISLGEHVRGQRVNVR